MTPQCQRLLAYFEYDHLPEELQVVSRPFFELAFAHAKRDVRDPAEQTVAIRKLLEAKDCAVRSVLGINASRAAIRAASD